MTSAPTPPKKFCADCKFHKGGLDIAHCYHPAAGVVSTVTKKLHWDFCSWMRSKDGKCGPDAELFEQAAASFFRTLRRVWLDFMASDGP